jgi:hypothetical protein
MGQTSGCSTISLELCARDKNQDTTGISNNQYFDSQTSAVAYDKPEDVLRDTQMSLEALASHRWYHDEPATRAFGNSDENLDVWMQRLRLQRTNAADSSEVAAEDAAGGHLAAAIAGSEAIGTGSLDQDDDIDIVDFEDAQPFLFDGAGDVKNDAAVAVAAESAKTQLDNDRENSLPDAPAEASVKASEQRDDREIVVQVMAPKSGIEEPRLSHEAGRSLDCRAIERAVGDDSVVCHRQSPEEPCGSRIAAVAAAPSPVRDRSISRALYHIAEVNLFLTADAAFDSDCHDGEARGSFPQSQPTPERRKSGAKRSASHRNTAGGSINCQQRGGRSEERRRAVAARDDQMRKMEMMMW